MCQKLRLILSCLKTAQKNLTSSGCAATRKTHAGFTITEVVVASSLLVVAMVPILKALTAAHLNSTIIERKTRSLSLAQAKLDDIKVRSIYDYTSSYAVSNLALDGDYLCNVADTGSASDIRTVTVDVGLDLDDNSVLAAGEVSVSLDTMLAKRW